MKLRYKIWMGVLIIITLLPLFTLAYGGEKDVGTTGATFLKLPTSARALALGNAYTAIGGDIHCISYNVAGLARTNSSELSAVHLQWFQDVAYEYLAYAQKLGNDTLALSLAYVDLGSIQRTTASKQEGAGLPSFTPKDYLFNLSYAKNIQNNFQAGLSLKFIKEEIYDWDDTSVALDIGIMANLNNMLSLGASIQNLGSKLDKDKLPLSIKLGSSIKLLPEESILLALDLNVPIDNKMNIHAGAEYNILNNILLRCGYSFGPQDKKGICYGIGFSISRYHLSYAYAPFGNLGDTHLFNLSINLGERQEDIRGY